MTLKLSILTIRTCTHSPLPLSLPQELKHSTDANAIHIILLKNCCVMVIRKIMIPFTGRAEFTITINKVLTDMQARAKLAFLARSFIIVEFADIWHRAICCCSLDFAFVHDYFQNVLQKGGTEKV